MAGATGATTRALLLRRLFLVVVLLAGPAAGVVVWSGKDGEHAHDLVVSMWAVMTFLVLVLALTEVAGKSSTNANRRKYGFLEILVGADGYASTSKAVVWLWTLVLASALVQLSAMVALSDLDATLAFGKDWSPYLLLLGGPFAASVLAKGLATSKAESGSGGVGTSTGAAAGGALGTQPGEQQGPKVSDLLTNSNGGTSLPDTQYVIFTLVATFYFLGAYIENLVHYASGDKAITLPEIPAAILGLTSLAAATYVGAKAVESNGVRIVTLTPTTTTAGGTIAVALVNATTALTQGNTTVLFTLAGVSQTFAPVTDPVRAGALTTFDVVVPAGVGEYEVTVSTPDGSTSARTFVVTAP